MEFVDDPACFGGESRLMVAPMMAAKQQCGSAFQFDKNIRLGATAIAPVRRVEQREGERLCG